jgi:hypothetical protein
MRLPLRTAALVFLIGCTSSEPKTELATRTAHSWEASVRMTAEALDQGSVPRLYARQVLRAAVQSRRKQAEQPEWNTLSAEARAGLDRSIHQLASSLGESPPSPANE